MHVVIRGVILGALLLNGCSLVFDERASPANDAGDEEDARVDAALGPTCVRNQDCASGACNVAEGQCVSEEFIRYVDSGSGANRSDCGATDKLPCKTIEYTLDERLSSTIRILVLRSGDYKQLVVDEQYDTALIRVIGQNAVITTETGTSVSAKQGRNLSVEDLSIHNGTQHGASCVEASLQLINVNIQNNMRKGVSATNCENLVIDRCYIRKNAFGGIITNDETSIAIQNTFVVKNGGPNTAEQGGVHFSDNTLGTFRFNTVADNKSNHVNGEGVNCNGSNVKVQATNNIIMVDNDTEDGVNRRDAVSGGSCNWEYSNLYNEKTPKTAPDEGPTNFDQKPIFLATDNGDYRLAEGSPEIDSADPNATLRVDFDFDRRPQGKADMGADERIP